MESKTCFSNCCTAVFSTAVMTDVYCFSLLAEAWYDMFISLSTHSKVHIELHIYLLIIRKCYRAKDSPWSVDALTAASVMDLPTLQSSSIFASECTRPPTGESMLAQDSSTQTVCWPTAIVTGLWPTVSNQHAGHRLVDRADISPVGLTRWKHSTIAAILCIARSDIKIIKAAVLESVCRNAFWS